MSKATRVFLFSALLLAGSAPWLSAKDVAAVVTKISGVLQVKQPLQSQYKPAKKGDFVYEGSVMKTGKGSRAALSFVNGVEVKINENTIYRVRKTKPADRGRGISTLLEKGRMWFKVLRKKNKFQIRTPIAAVSVRGTEGDVRFGNNMRATCYSGSFEVTPYTPAPDGDPNDGTGDFDEGEGGVLVSAGQIAIVQPGKPPEIVPLTQGSDGDDWQQKIKFIRKGEIKLVLNNTETRPRKPVKLILTAYDSGGHRDKAFNALVGLSTDQDSGEFSRNRSGWTKGPFSLTLQKGRGECWVRVADPGVTNVSAQKDGYDILPVRLNVAQPSEREVEIDVETESGERKRLKMKFRR